MLAGTQSRRLELLYRCAGDDELSASTSERFKIGDRVVVNACVTAVQAMQEGHGGWNPKMQEVGDAVRGLFTKFIV